MTWAQIAIAVRGETAKNKTGVAFRHDLEHRGRGDRAGAPAWDSVPRSIGRS